MVAFNKVMILIENSAILIMIVYRRNVAIQLMSLTKNTHRTVLKEAALQVVRVYWIVAVVNQHV